MINERVLFDVGNKKKKKEKTSKDNLRPAREIN